MQYGYCFVWVKYIVAGKENTIVCQKTTTTKTETNKPGTWKSDIDIQKKEKKANNGGKILATVLSNTDSFIISRTDLSCVE